ncbi:hypothetical protein [Streptomyces sp. NPDC048242]|uniref:hypothetical protein n=1 Tax=Streptomyces sp. NPDC048242 TaxID=3155026 RepID=UPI003420527B
MRRSTRITTLAAGTAAAAALVVTGLAVGHTPTRAAAHEPRKTGVVVAHGADRHPSQTATDWVTYADHVVEVTPVDERDIPPSQEEVDRGEGVILRGVTLRVDKVLWTRSGATQAAPASFDWTAYGWQFTDGDVHNRTEMAGEGQPRIETGHHYVMALEWEAPRCVPGDGELPGRWRGLGSESIIPYDNGVLGEGEFQGRPLQLKAARATALDPGDPDYSLRDEFTGHTAAELADRLTGTAPGQKTQRSLRQADAPAEECS